MDEISIIEYKGARVLTTQQLAEAYGQMHRLLQITTIEIKTDILRANIIFVLQGRN